MLEGLGSARDRRKVTMWAAMTWEVSEAIAINYVDTHLHHAEFVWYG
ncbi:unnamed protein product, partial [marine sediment metagenome]